MNLRKLTALFALLVLLAAPVTAAAAPFKVGLMVNSPEEGVFCSELVYNDQVLWRLQLLTDGARPVTGGGGGQTTIVVPDIVNGLFLIKFSRQ
ncbi:MAG: hypothetical protein N2491_10970 [Negativicutes bacterium]|nr:hypothetical protein [Negativicutes bacterium]